MDKDVREDATQALERINRALSTKTADAQSSDMSHASTHIAAMRDRLTMRCRQSGRRSDDLDRVNQLLSMTASAEFPVKGIHWTEARSRAGHARRHAARNRQLASAIFALRSTSLVIWRRRMGIEPTVRFWRATGFEDQGGHQTPVASEFVLHDVVARHFA